MTALDISSVLGLGAMTLLTLNILLGMLISTHYNPVRRWPHRRIDTVGIHNWTGYLALVVAIVHPLVILLSSTAHFVFRDLVYPLGAPKQPYINTLGAAALYCLAIVVLTSRVRRSLGRRLWKRVHFLTYLLAPLFLVHGLLTDPELKDRPTDFVDAEKVYVELCAVVIASGAVARVRWQLRQPPARVHRARARDIAA